MKFCMRRCCLFSALLALLLPQPPSWAQTAASQKFTMALVCGPFTGNPPAPAFADKFTLEFSKGALTGDRATRVQKGKETYKGSVDPAGKIKITGSGRFEDRSREWSSEFAGKLQDKKPTILNGSMRVKDAKAGPYVNKCSIAFLLPPADLAKALLPNEAAPQPRPQ